MQLLIILLGCVAGLIVYYVVRNRELKKEILRAQDSSKARAEMMQKYGLEMVKAKEAGDQAGFRSAALCYLQVRDGHTHNLHEFVGVTIQSDSSRDF